MSDQDYENTIGQLDDRIEALQKQVESLEFQLADMEEKCQFWCDEARKLGYKE